jgi:hypothetical protein
MNIDDNILYYERAQLNSNTECPYHPGNYFKVNGVGGAGMPLVNKILKKLPTSQLFFGAACTHDVLYSLVTNSHVIVVYPDNAIFLLTDKVDVDNLFLNEMLELSNTQPRWYRWIYKIFAWIMYLFVRFLGYKFFKHEHR